MVCNTLNNSIFIKKKSRIIIFDIEFGINFSLFINILFCNKIIWHAKIKNKQNAQNEEMQKINYGKALKNYI